MTKEIIINVHPKEKRMALTSNGQLDEFYIERPQDKTIVGNIYKGKIEAVLPAIGGAFVDIGLPKKGFLYLSEIEYAFESIEPQDPKQKKAPKEVKKGQDVLVQVVKESFGTKGPRLSCHIGIPGRYLVLMPLEGQVGISRRIDDDAERKRLRQIFADMKLPKDLGFIVRTACEGKTKLELERDAQFLMKLWQRMEQTVKGRPAPSLIYEEYDLTLRVIRDSFTEDVSKLIVDSKDEFFRILRFMKSSFLRHMTNRVVLYKGEDLFGEKDMEKQISRVFESKVYLKSKAYLVIEPTEGLVVIDVNSGGFKKRIEQEEAAFKVNCEAATEVGRQLRLRDLGGIIVIDFIDMEREGHRREVLNCLRKALSSDRAKYDILGISKFGVVEMTRERVHNTVQTISYDLCPYCQGRGKVKSSVTMSIYALKELRKHLQGKNLREVTVTVNPTLAEEIMRDKDSLRSIESRFHTHINISPNPLQHIEDIKIS